MPPAAPAAAGSSPSGMYDEDLAWVHEAGFSDLAEAAARMACELAPPGPIADLGCGGGTLLAEAARLGRLGWGSDISPAMVELARRKVPGARFEVGDALTVPIPAGAAAVTMVGEILCYALPHVAEEAREAAVDALLRRIRGALVPGGILLTDVATTAKAQGEREVERKGPGWRVHAHVAVDGTRLVRTIDSWRMVRGRERHAREVHEQLLIDPAWLEERMVAAGFAVERLGGYDDFGFQAGWDGFLARRPG